MKRKKRLNGKQVLIVGSGDVARRIIPWLATRFGVRALVRRAEECEALRALGALPLVADLDDPASLARLAGIAGDVLHCAPPPGKGEDDPRTRHLLAALTRRGSLPRRIIYISTTGVYGDCQGAWLDETRPLRPSSARAGRRVAAERCLRDFALRTGCRVSILRAPGIYDSAGRLPLGRLEKGDPVLTPAEDVHTNHIHAEDLARLLVTALFRGRPNRAYNASDDSQLKMGDYFDLVADTVGLPRPPRLSRQELMGCLSPLTLSFMSESRRLRNERIRKELRFRLAYPTVASSLAEWTERHYLPLP
ncbi:SDR family oxidoreductase [Zoogloea sp.]|uniref:SDR family oxidoreductase n=1 Tax=Zoogloea sp. TaxID=49181 RepID=UPI00262A45E1|nr:SDR family oxidoreductase [Zoogloea sp.]MDD3353417.1 SDR family oxidoreductase [Zoogloea sp.]